MSEEIFYDGQAQPTRRSVDPVDQARMLGAIREVLKDEKIEALYDVAAGAAHGELAAERGVSPTASRKDSQRSRERAFGARPGPS